MARSVHEVLEDLNRAATVQVYSSRSLIADVDTAAGVIDKERRSKGKPEGDRKPVLKRLTVAGSRPSSPRATSWEVLHSMARGLALARQGMGRGLAEHWQCLKYCQAIGRNDHDVIALTAEGKRPERGYKTMQGTELSIGFGLSVAEDYVARRFPDHVISVVGTANVLLAGWSLGGQDSSKGSRARPDFLLEAWKPGEPSRLFLVSCKGNHQRPLTRPSKAVRTVARQLARGSEEAEGLHIHRWNAAPCLVTSSEFLSGNGIVVNALQAPGAVSLPGLPGSGPDSPDRPVEPGIDQRNLPYLQQIARPVSSRNREGLSDGFMVSDGDLPWFTAMLNRAGSATLTAFVGGGRATAQYLTEHQGRRFYDIPTIAGSSSVHDAEIRLNDRKYVGTDHVFRLGKIRVVAFSGIADHLYPLLAQGQVTAYREKAYAYRAEHLRIAAEPHWHGPVSFRPDGTVMALQILTA